jgi:hypothetical protein
VVGQPGGDDEGVADGDRRPGGDDEGDDEGVAQPRRLALVRGGLLVSLAACHCGTAAYVAGIPGRLLAPYVAGHLFTVTLAVFCKMRRVQRADAAAG